MNALRNVLPLTRYLPLKNLTSKTQSARTYAFISDLKIKWVRPEKIPCIKPEKSGDLEGMTSLDLSQPQIQFQDSKELATADETVKKLFSLEYAPRKEACQLYRNLTKGKVQRHDHDVGSIEVKIARWTSIIRALQEVMEKYPRNKRTKVFLKELIDHRKKHLKYLRRWDYKRFEWLLEVLNIVYKPPPNHFHWITRKESLQKLTDKHCENIKQERLDAYKKILQDQQPLFLREKIRALEFIRNEQQECGTAVTVSEEEIETVRKQLEDLEQERSKIVRKETEEDDE